MLELSNHNKQSHSLNNSNSTSKVEAYSWGRCRFHLCATQTTFLLQFVKYSYSKWKTPTVSISLSFHEEGWNHTFRGILKRNHNFILHRCNDSFYYWYHSSFRYLAVPPLSHRVACLLLCCVLLWISMLVCMHDIYHCISYAMCSDLLMETCLFIESFALTVKSLKGQLLPTRICAACDQCGSANRTVIHVCYTCEMLNEGRLTKIYLSN